MTSRYSVALCCSAVLLAGCARHSMTASAPASDPQVAQALANLRTATRPYQSLDAAVAAGYPRDVTDCIVHENHGAMGFHHLNRAYVEKDISVARPQMLLYERVPGGEYRLNGVEFVIPFRFWPRDSVAPTFMGQRMKPEFNLNYWYLHVWAWKDNPQGLFADFHPTVQCAEETRKVYRPNPPGA